MSDVVPYEIRRGEIETYFDRTAADAWKKLTSDAPLGRIRASVRAGREQMRSFLLSLMPADLTGARVLDAGCGTGALAIALAARDDGKKLDGSVAAPPFAIAIVDRVYAGMRDSLARAYLRTGYDGPADAAAVARLSSWLPPFDRELERGYHVIQRGEAWYREVLGTWISRGMADSAGAIARAFADGERVRSDGDVSAWFDRDPRTGAVLAGDQAAFTIPCIAVGIVRRGSEHADLRCFFRPAQQPVVRNITPDQTAHISEPDRTFRPACPGV